MADGKVRRLAAPHAGRATRAMRALDDGALAAEVRAGNPVAWGELDARFRPLLERMARRMEIPSADWPECIDEVIEDAAMKLATGSAQPEQLAPWLVGAMRRRHLAVRRANDRRERRYADAALLSVLHVSEPAPAYEVDGNDGAVRRLARLVADVLDERDRLVLVWVGEGVPRRLIAEWTGSTYEATRKRIQRLCIKVRAMVVARAAELNAADRRTLARMLRASDPEPDRRATGDTGQ